MGLCMGNIRICAWSPSCNQMPSLTASQVTALIAQAFISVSYHNATKTPTDMMEHIADILYWGMSVLDDSTNLPPSAKLTHLQHKQHLRHLLNGVWSLCRHCAASVAPWNHLPERSTDATCSGYPAICDQCVASADHTVPMRSPQEVMGKIDRLIQ